MEKRYNMLDKCTKEFHKEIRYKKPITLEKKTTFWSPLIVETVKPITNMLPY